MYSSSNFAPFFARIFTTVLFCCYQLIGPMIKSWWAFTWCTISLDWISSLSVSVNLHRSLSVVSLSIVSSVSLFTTVMLSIYISTSPPIFKSVVFSIISINIRIDIAPQCSARRELFTYPFSDFPHPVIIVLSW